MDKLDFNKPIIVELNGISAESEFDRISEYFMQKYPFTEIDRISEYFMQEYPFTEIERFLVVPFRYKIIKVCSLTAFYEMETILTDFEEKYPLTKIHQE